MPVCAGTWVPKPTYTAVNVALSLVDAGILEVTGLVELAPWLAGQPVIGSVVATGLCTSNPNDPGDFNPSMLFPPAVYGTLPGPQQPPGTLMRWVWDKCYYWAFTDACMCSATNAPPPAPTVITPITNYDNSVTNVDNRSQLTVIQNNQTTGAESQQQLYNMHQHGNSLIGDLWARSVPNLMQDYYGAQLNLSGEGEFALTGSNGEQPPWFSTRSTWLKIRVEQVGPKVGIRGTVNPRLYGVGSLKFLSNQRISEPPLAVGRHPIHAYYEVAFIPPRAIVDRIGYRLMPGNVVSVWEGGVSTDNVQFSPTSSTLYGWLPYGNYVLPPNWHDPPIYP